MLTVLGNDLSVGGDLRVPLPETFDGDLNEWEDWRWTFKAYVLLFHPDIDEWFDYVERLEVEFTDDFLKTSRPPTGSSAISEDLTEEQCEDWKKRVAISKRLHYLLANLTVGAVKTEVKNNLKGNGFETWRRLTERFSLLGAAEHMGLLSKILEYTFSTQNFEQDLASWEDLKNKYKHQTGTVLPDGVLIAIL